MRTGLHPNLFPNVAGVKPVVAAPAKTDVIKRPKRPRAKPESTSWGDKVADFLRTNGPARSDEICNAIGLDSAVGIAPFIKARVKHGQIVRDGYRYALADGVKRPKSDDRS
jgi:hypothetical protein